MIRNLSQMAEVVDSTTLEGGEAKDASQNFKDKITQMAYEYSLKQSQDEEDGLIKSYIAILTSSLGGIDHTSDIVPPPFKLGDEALLCLKDLKKWLIGYDEKRNTWSVAAACGDSGLVINSLVPILCQWSDNVENDGFRSNLEKELHNKIALSTLELLNSLTWPVLLSGIYRDQMKYYNQLRSIQLAYKKHILGYQNGKTLKSILHIAMPIILKEKLERTPKDNQILKMCLSIFRNILFIEPTPLTKHKSRNLKASELVENLPEGVNIFDINLDACLSAFHQNDVFTFILTITNLLDKEFDSGFFAEICLEIVFLLTKGIQPSDPYGTIRQKQQKSSTPVKTSIATPNSKLGLKDLLDKENKLKQSLQKSGSSRHSRFGTLLSLQTADQGRLTLSGQKNLTVVNPLKQFDARKTINKVKPVKYLSDEDVIFSKVHLSRESSAVLCDFANDFLDSSFNILIKSNSKILTNGDEVLTYIKIQFLLVITWFLQAERARNELTPDKIDYGLITCALDDTTFILVFKYLETTQEHLKLWNLAHAATICFKEIVKTAYLMGKSSDEVDRDVSSSIKQKLFHKQHYLELLTKLPRDAHKQSPDYVHNVIDLVYIVLKTLEDYSNEDVEFLVDQKQRRRKKKLTREINHEEEAWDELDGVNDKDRIYRKGKQLSNKRKFEFKKYQTDFVHQSTIDTYISFLARFRDLDEKELKKGIQFLHMIFHTHKIHVLLYRLDFMTLLHTLLSPDGLAEGTSIRKHFQNFLDYFMKKLVDSLDKTPSLFIELLFARSGKNSDLNFYLETGLIKEIAAAKTIYATKSIAISGAKDMDLDKLIGIVVASLIDDDKRDLVEWVVNIFEKLILFRVSSEELDDPANRDLTAHERSAKIRDFVIKPTDQLRKNVLIKEPKVRFLLEKALFKLPDSNKDECIFPRYEELDNVKEVLNIIQKYLVQSIDLGEGKVANDFIIIETNNVDDDGFVMYHNDDEDDVWNGASTGNANNGDDEIAFEVEGTRTNNTGYNDDLLDNLEEAIVSSNLPKGVARAKNKKPLKRQRRRHELNSEDELDLELELDNDFDSIRSRSKKKSKKRKQPGSSALPMHDISDDEDLKKNQEKLMAKKYTSSRYVVDSDEEDDEQFFENERKLRELLSNNNGVIDKELIKEFREKRLGDKSAEIVSEPALNPIVQFSENDTDSSDNEVRLPTEKPDLEEESSDSEMEDSFISRAKRIIEDDEDELVSEVTREDHSLTKRAEESSDSEMEDSFISTKKKRNVILDDDDDE